MGIKCQLTDDVT